MLRGCFNYACGLRPGLKAYTADSMQSKLLKNVLNEYSPTTIHHIKPVGLNTKCF